MTGGQKRNLLMGMLALALFAVAGYLYFKDSAPKDAEQPPAEQTATVDAVTKAAGGGSGQPEPDDPRARPRGSGKMSSH